MTPGIAKQDGWWYRASTERKLRQLDAGIELGLTGQQIAMASGCKGGGTVRGFAADHGRIIRGTAGGRRNNGVALVDGELMSTKQAGQRRRGLAFLAGEEVDFWSDPGAHRDRPEPEVAEVKFE